jgi:hypothetical protein
MEYLMIKKFMLLQMWLIVGFLSGISVSGSNRLLINEIGLTATLVAERRLGSSSQEPITFTAFSESYSDSIAIEYISPEMDLRLSFTKITGFGEGVWQSTARAVFNTEMKLRKLILTFSFEDQPSIHFYAGPSAVKTLDSAYNKMITPYSDKIVAYGNSDHRFWIVASNYRGCDGVEALPVNQVSLYDFALHHFRQYQEGGSQVYYPMDCKPVQAGDQCQWSWLWFQSEPVILALKRWPKDYRAALGITSDPDSGTEDKIQAIYLGSNNPNNPKYGNAGFIKHGIPVSQGIFGVNCTTHGHLYDILLDSSNSIAYHSFSELEDPPGSNAQALLSDLVHYNIRMWTDHNIPMNPECLGYNGLDPSSPSFIGDVINQSGICYAWMNDNVATNPFNSFDDPWRLPHLLPEMTALTKPVWFFGRTKALTWEYLNGNTKLDMKHTMTPENLDQLLVTEGLHISYTNLLGTNGTPQNAYYIVAPNGDYEIRPEVEEMIRMLAYYREYKQLWIDTPENIFDRMLATEKVIIESVTTDPERGDKRVIIRNNSDLTLSDFTLSYNGDNSTIPAFISRGACEFGIDSSSIYTTPIPRSSCYVAYMNNIVQIKLHGGKQVDLRRVTIYNLRGQKVFSLDYPNPALVLEFPFQGFASGVYFASLETRDHSILNTRFIVLK